jgi:hypothetical protein
MAVIDNHTGVPHFWFEQTGPDGERLDVLIIRATFDFAANGARISLATQQRPVAFGDQFEGDASSDPLRAVLQDDGDLLPFKPGTDILISGHAHAPNGRPQLAWLASVEVGQVKKVLRLHGPRQFRKRFFGWRLDPTEPTTSIPLDYRLAYGGCIDIPDSLSDDGKPDAIKYPGNPAGCGWLPDRAAYKRLSRPARRHVARWISELRVLRAPQIESVTDPVRHPHHNVATQGFGPLPRWWAPRLAYQGTCDDQWLRTRYPLLPGDFDSRFFQTAPPDLIAAPHLTGDESVTLAGLLAEPCEMRLPGWRILAVSTIDSTPQALLAFQYLTQFDLISMLARFRLSGVRTSNAMTRYPKSRSPPQRWQLTAITHRQ